MLDTRTYNSHSVACYVHTACPKFLTSLEQAVDITTCMSRSDLLQDIYNEAEQS